MNKFMLFIGVLLVLSISFITCSDSPSESEKPQSKGWTEKAPMPTPRFVFSSA